MDNNLKAHRELVLYKIKKSGTLSMDITFWSSFTVGFLLSIRSEKFSQST